MSVCGIAHQATSGVHRIARIPAPVMAAPKAAPGWTARPPISGIQRGATSPHRLTRPSVRNAASSQSTVSITIQNWAGSVRNGTNPASV